MATPRALVIQAERVEMALAGGPVARRRLERAWPRRGLVWRTKDPHVARFSIRGLDPNALYRLRIGAPPNPCGKVFWRGPFDGFVVPGQDGVRIEGFAARTEVEVFDEVADTWVASAALDFDTTDISGSSKRFRWRSSVPGAVGGELQIASRAFPTQGEFGSCDEPDAGLLARIPVAIARGGWVEPPPIDFATLLFPDGDPPPDGGVIFEPPPGGDFPLDVVDVDNTALVSEAEQLATLRDIARGAPLYIRVVPQTTAGPACDLREQGVHGWALVARLPNLDEIDLPTEPPPPRPLSAGDGHFYAPPFTGGVAQGFPTYGQVAYKIIGEHTLPPIPCIGIGGSIYREKDPIGCAAIDLGAAPGSKIEAGAAIQPGMWFYYTPQSSGGGGGGFSLSTITNGLTSLATGIYTAAGFVIDGLSKLYEDIKTAVKDVALDAILFVPGLNDLCHVDGVDCEKLVEIGLNTGLAAVGLPPSLPNFDQLKGQGLEYLASQIESQTGVPSYLSEKALVIATKAVEDMSAHRGGSGPNFNWVVPYLGFDPAYLELVVRKNDDTALPENLVLSRNETELYRGGSLPIPSAFPASGDLRIPMVLQPSLSGIPAPLCTYDFGEISCVGIFPPGLPPVCQQTKWDFDTSSWVFNVVDCSSLGAFPPPAIYYRDQWIARKLDATDCSIVGASTRLGSFFNFFLSPPPEELQMGISAFVQPRQPFGWSGWLGFGC